MSASDTAATASLAHFAFTGHTVITHRIATDLGIVVRSL
jgi:hypothetical protein